MDSREAFLLPSLENINISEWLLWANHTGGKVNTTVFHSDGLM